MTCSSFAKWREVNGDDLWHSCQAWIGEDRWPVALFVTCGGAIRENTQHFLSRMESGKNELWHFFFFEFGGEKRDDKSHVCRAWSCKQRWPEALNSVKHGETNRNVSKNGPVLKMENKGSVASVFQSRPFLTASNTIAGNVHLIEWPFP